MKTAYIRLRGKDRVALFSDLSTMLIAGIPILQCLDTLLEDAKGSPRKVLAHMQKRLADGSPLSQAMEELPRAFEPITVNLIRAAEAGGTLEETLIDIVKTQKKELEFSSNLRTTMVYPAFVGVIFLGIVILMLTFVVPRVEKVFLSLRVSLPPTTKFMFAASNVFMHNWLMISVGFVAGIVLVSVLVAYYKRLIIRGLLALPGLNNLGKNIDLTRFTRSFALLLKAGVPLDEALQLSERVVQKGSVVKVIRQMNADITAGESLSTHLHDFKHVIPTMMARSIETAETSGTLEKTMQNLSEYFNEQVEQNLKVLSSLIEPTMIVIVGLMVGTLMLTIMAPMYNLISQIKGK